MTQGARTRKALSTRKRVRTPSLVPATTKVLVKPAAEKSPHWFDRFLLLFGLKRA